MGDLTLEHYFASQQGYATTTPAYDENFTRPIVSEVELSNYIFEGYLKTRRPRRNLLDVVDVFMGLSLIVINELLERDQAMVTTVLMTLQWRDDYLVWNTTDRFAHIDSLVVYANEVWLPDYSNVNSGDLYKLQRSSDLMLLTINSHGMIEFLPEATITTFCDLDMTYFPYDEQICPIRFEAWTFFPQQQMFRLYDPAINVQKLRPNEQWELLNLSANQYISCYTNTTDDCCYTGMQYTIHVKRKAAYYNINIIAPSLIIAFVQAVIFALPTREPQKIHISFTNLLAYAVFQDTVSQLLPRSSEHPPLLAVFINLQMAYIGVALFGEGWVFMCENRATRREPVPPKLLRFGEVIARYLGIDPESIIVVEDGTDRVENTDLVINEIKNMFVSEEPGFHHSRKPSRRQRPNDEGSTDSDSDLFAAREVQYSNVYIPHIYSHYRPLHPEPAGQKLHPHDDTPQGNNNSQNQQENKPRKSNKNRFKWLFLAEILDRLTMIVYLLLISLTPAVIFWIMPSLNPTVNSG